MLLFRNREFRLSSSDGGNQAASDEIFLDENVPIDDAITILEGIDVQFANRNDRELGRLRVELGTSVTGATGHHIVITADCALRDWSGGDNDLNGDDPFTANIRYSVLIIP